TRAAHTLAAGAAEGERRVDLVLDLDERVQDHRPAALQVDRVGVDPRILVQVRIVAVDPELLRAFRLLAVGELRRRPGLALLRSAALGQSELDHRQTLMRMWRRSCLAKRARACKPILPAPTKARTS